MHAASPEKLIRRASLILGALPVLFVTGIIWSDSFVAFDQSRTLSVNAALSEGLLQGFLVLNAALFFAAIGLWRRRGWARWLTTSWFPLLSVHNLAVEMLHTANIQGESWLQSILLSTLWVASIGSVVFGPAASIYFERDVHG